MPQERDRAIGSERDLTPLTIGARTDSGATLPIIPRGTPIPVARSLSVPVPTTRPDFFCLELVQDERAMASDNRPFAKAVVTGLRRLGAPATIRIMVAIDAFGVLTVEAVEDRAGGVLIVELHDVAGGLSRNDAEALVREAAKFRELDEPKRRALLRQSQWLLQ